MSVYIPLIAQRAGSIYRRPRNGILFINRLFAIPGIQLGIPGLRLEHFLFDSMHFADLGILHYFMGEVLWALAGLGFFGEMTDHDHDGADCALKDAYTSWCKRFRVPDSERLVALSFNMCGTSESPLLKLKAGKSRAALPFIVYLLRSAGGRDLLDNADPAVSKGSKLLEVGEGMLTYYKILRTQPRKMDDLAIQHMGVVVRKTSLAWTGSGRSCTMKFHVFARHIVEQARWAGNPGYSHNYRDEAENFATRKRSVGVNRVKLFTLRETPPTSPS